MLRWTQPAVLVMAIAAKSNWKPLAVTLAASCVAASLVLDRFISAFYDLRQHVAGSQERIAAGAMIVAMRDGCQRLVPCSSLVPGDIIYLGGGLQGSLVPADCRVLESRGLRIDDSFLPCPWPQSLAMAIRTNVLAFCLGNQRGAQVLGRAVNAEADKEGIRLLNSRCVALAASTVPAGSATVLVTRTGSSTFVCNLLSHLASFSLVDVFFSPWLI